VEGCSLGGMTLRVEAPGRPALELDFLLLDVNGTLADRGTVLAGVEERIAALADELEPRLLSADTFGSLGEVAARLGAQAQAVEGGEEKLRVVRELGAERCAAIGNGANDALMLGEAALGIAVVGPEGAAGATLAAADVVCGSILAALDLLREPRALAATLRP
jgi:soluble P-type ATPase